MKHTIIHLPVCNARVDEDAPEAINGPVHYKASHGEPSMFTQTQGVIHPRWINWQMEKFKMGRELATNIGEALMYTLEREPRRPADAVEPLVTVGSTGRVSMAWVIWYKHHAGCTFQEAQRFGSDLIELQASMPGSEIIRIDPDSDVDVPLAEKARA